MAQLMITGHNARQGTIKISGSKNASLPLMAASLLTNQNVTLKNVPKITDVDKMKSQLMSYGVRVNGEGTEASPMVLNSSNAVSSPNAQGENIRGAFLVLGPLLARFREATVFTPGGCNIEKNGRPVDFHVNALEEMGATLDNNTLKAPNGLHGAEIIFPKSSVGATENIVMAACLAQGKTTIKNAALEPEVMDLVDMLRKMGASIEDYVEQKTIIVNGRREFLSGTTHTVIPDRIEAGSYAIAAAIVGGPLLLKMDPEKAGILTPIVEKLQEAGISTQWKRDGLEVRRGRYDTIFNVDVTTGPFPEFPTDLLPQWLTLMTQAEGTSKIKDTIYNNRFAHVPELQKMGAEIVPISESEYHVRGKRQLSGGHVKAKDLRGGMALILAALAAVGATVVKDIHHVYRGYEDLKEKLIQCGAQFEQLPATRPGHYGGR